VADWLGELDAQLQRSPDFFASRPIVVDLSASGLRGPGIRALFQALYERGIRVVGMEGVEMTALGTGLADLPPILGGGRPAGGVELPGAGGQAAPAEAPEPAQAAPPEPQPAPVPAGEANSLLLDQSVRSGQSVHFPRGDVTVLGAVASGAEIVAGGSIHVYGALRGRAIAGLTGDARARIFCQRLDAELLAIDGAYTTADDMDPALRGRPVQAWRQGEAIAMAALD